MKNIQAKLSNLIKRGAITLTNADNKSVSYGQVKYLGKTALVENVYPYGLNAHAPVGGISLLFSVGDNEGNLASIPYCQSERFKNLKPGEVVIGSPATGSYIKFSQSNEIIAQAPQIIPSRLFATNGNKAMVSTNLINWVHTSNLSVADDAAGGININIPAADIEYWNDKEPPIPTGGIGQYWRGDKSWQTLNAEAVGLGNVTNDAQVKRAEMGVASGVATLDSSGLVPTSQIPPLYVNKVYVVSSQAAMLALSANVGDIAVRTDINKTFILESHPASTLSNWIELLFPLSPVISVNGLVGAVSLGALSPLSWNATDNRYEIQQANTSQGGFLSNTDWNIFNSKQSSALDDGKVFIGNALNIAASVTLSGDITNDNAGVVTIGLKKVTYTKIQDVSTNGRLLGRQSAGSGTIEEISTIPSSILGASSLYLGATAIPLNASSGSIPSLEVDIIGKTTSLAGGAANSIPYQSGTGVTTFLPSVNNAVLVTNSLGVPTWSTSIPTSVTLQSAYNASLSPQITTSNSLGAFRIKSWDASDLATIQEWADSTGAVTASINGGGKMIASGGFVGNLDGNASTATNIVGGNTNYLPYQTNINTTGFIAPVNNAILVTNGSGEPSWSTSIPVIGQDNVLLPTTTASVGLIKWNNVTVMHTYGANNNLFVGTGQGNFTHTGANDFTFGTGSLISLTTGFNNGTFGYWNLRGLTTGQSNYVVGSLCANLLVSGNYNLFLGDAAGSAYTADESGNICIHSPGVAGEWNTIRIGEPGTGAGQQNKAYMAGIYNIIPTSATKKVMLVADDHQLGSSTNLSFNSTTNTLSTTNFAGALTGNVTGNVSGSSGSCTGNSLTATTSTNSNNASITELHTAATYYMTCVPSASSAYQQVYTSTNAPTISMSTGELTAVSALGCKAGTSAGGVHHYRLFTTGGVIRSAIGLGVAETGSGNTGADIYCWLYDDAGAYLSVPFHIKRSTGVFYADVGLSLPTAGGTASVLNNYEEYTLTVNFTGPCTLSSVAIKCVRVGSTVTIMIPPATGTSTVGTVFSGSANLKANFRPPSSAGSYVTLQNLVVSNSASIQGWVAIGTNGSIQILANGGNFSASGTAGWDRPLVATFNMSF